MGATAIVDGWKIRAVRDPLWRVLATGPDGQEAAIDKLGDLCLLVTRIEYGTDRRAAIPLTRAIPRAVAIAMIGTPWLDPSTRPVM